jgi:hypothetical protein
MKGHRSRSLAASRTWTASRRLAPGLHAIDEEEHDASILSAFNFLPLAASTTKLLDPLRPQSGLEKLYTR